MTYCNEVLLGRSKKRLRKLTIQNNVLFMLSKLKLKNVLINQASTLGK